MARCFIHFGAVDYQCTVWVEGSMVGTHVGGHTPFSFEITNQVKDVLYSDKADDKLTIVVRAQDSLNDMSQPRGKQYWKQNAQGFSKPESIFYTPTTGIWQDVYLEYRPLKHIKSAHFASDIDAGTVRADVVVDLIETVSHVQLLTKPENWMTFTVKLDGKIITTCKTMVSHETNSCSTVINVRQAGTQPHGSMRTRMTTPGVLPPEVNRDRWDNGLALWSPESPTLYTVELALSNTMNKDVDVVCSYFGMRKVSIDDQGRFCLNNRVYFQKLILNQGYWPESGMTPLDDADYAKDIQQIKQMGFNGVRMHQKVESPRFVYEADRLGLLVWGEMANAYEFSTSYVERFTKEWIDVVRRDMSHPCIVAWVPVNESWGVPHLNTSAQQRAHLQSLYYLTKAIDPTRPVIDNDGWQHVETDMITVHDYRTAPELEAGFSSRAATLQERVTGYPILLPPLISSPRRDGLPILCTEFGGLALRVDNVQTTANGVNWGYANASDSQDFLRIFEAQVKALTKARSADGNRIVQGFCWTQFADVEQEVNGLVTKDRQFKIPPEQIKAILDAI
uniref:Glycoside hydrolase n=2 Tax=Kalmanozyma brasiliensis (strain GHG001) TaxID=1365824 RepID=V5F3R6_KALBG